MKTKEPPYTEPYVRIYYSEFGITLLEQNRCAIAAEVTHSNFYFYKKAVVNET